MHKLIALAATAATAAGFVAAATAPASAALTYNPNAATVDAKFCQDGVTKQKVAFTNYRATRRVQFNLRRTNDAAAPYYTSFYVRPGDRKIAWVSVEFDTTVSLRVRSPESADPNSLMVSKVISALPGCRKIVRAPVATLGGTTCIGVDSVVTINLDNRASTDAAVEYQTTATQPESTTTDTTTVPNRTLRNTYVMARSGDDPVHIVVTDTETGTTLLTRDVPARAC